MLVKVLLITQMTDISSNDCSVFLCVGRCGNLSYVLPIMEPVDPLV